LYYDQIQGIMALENLKCGDFVVRIAKYTCIQRYLFNQLYWTNLMKPKMIAWYTKVFVPKLVAKQMGKLEYGEIEPVLRLAPLHSKSPQGAAAATKAQSDFDFGDDGGQAVRTITVVKKRSYPGSSSSSSAAAASSNKRPRSDADFDM